ncbi:hypothetical protein [Microbacterium sp. No. 7]|uniref:hypothetical protein n=1 Tax=Microbacterium sp. No. 7 TaxID=1714373 RepID=UPI0006D1F900|nr:hypothetical protein [Microbacterium sp. No. 7]ALJ21519.1 hypothetical protein AOA12_17120 [Microbacterium sp. No. 7]
MTLTATQLTAPDGIAAALGWDPGTGVHDRRRHLAQRLIAERLDCTPDEIVIEREEARGFGHHPRLVASRDGRELDLVIATASYRTATVVAVGEPAVRMGLDIRDLHPEPSDLRTMMRHSHLLEEASSTDLLHHWVSVQAVLDADGRPVRPVADKVRLNAKRSRGWLLDRKAQYELVHASRDGWIIAIAKALPDVG